MYGVTVGSSFGARGTITSLLSLFCDTGRDSFLLDFSVRFLCDGVVEGVSSAVTSLTYKMSLIDKHASRISDHITQIRKLARHVFRHFFLEMNGQVNNGVMFSW